LLAVAYKDDVWMPGKTLVFDAMGTVGVYIGGPGGPSANVDPLPVLTKSVPTAGDGALARRDDGFLLKFSRTGIINIPPGTSEDLLDGVAIENITVHANADLSMWGMNDNALVFPAFGEYVAYLLEVRLDGDTGGAGGQPREFTVSLVRQVAGTTVVKAGIVKLDNTDLKANSVNFSTWTKGVDDPYIDGGVRVVLNNTSGQQITLSQVDLVIKGTRH